MTDDLLSRRLFLQQGAGAAGAAWAKVALPGLAAISQAACTAKEEQQPFTILTADEAIELEAIAARIIPTTSTPGAREAGVIYFIDQSFGTFNAPMLPVVRDGLKEFEAGINANRKFSSLSDSEQDAYLEAKQDTPFFGLMRLMSFSGYVGLSQYGGNKNGVGWQLLGMDPTVHMYQSPFGYYDAEYLRQKSDG